MDHTVEFGQQRGPLGRPLPHPQAEGVVEAEDDVVLTALDPRAQHAGTEAARVGLDAIGHTLGPLFEIGLAACHHRSRDGHGDRFAGQLRKLRRTEGSTEHCRCHVISTQHRDDEWASRF